MKSIRKANSGKNFAVVTGTGSGKTECFLLPMLNDILKEFEADGFSAGIRALILYPMNALANDQLKRLRELLEGTEVTFGRYTGDTEEKEYKAQQLWQEENPGVKRLPNELISREEIRKNPPNILLTNYSMLEYLLLRPEDAPLFGNAFGRNWRHIAIDEAHVYSGALGTEIAFLLRRLKARISSETGRAPELHCYATSATIGAEEDMPKVAKFAQDLFGEPFSQENDIDVITSSKNFPEKDLLNPWGTLGIDKWQKLRNLILVGNADWDRISELISEDVPSNAIEIASSYKDALEALGYVLLGENTTGLLVRKTSQEVIDLTSLKDMSNLGISGLHGDEEGIETLSSIVDVLSHAKRAPGVPILSSRYHSFLRAPEGLYVNLFTNRLMTEKAIEEDCGFENPVPVYETSVCRHCGQAYILGSREAGEAGKPAVLNPRHEGTDDDDDFLPRDFFRLLALDEEPDKEEELEWLCPACGSRYTGQLGGGHCFGHPEISRIPIAAGKATEEDAQCFHCGYQSKVAIQPMRVSPEAAGSVVCYDLVREVPSFERDENDSEDDLFADDFDEERRGGSIICFSDRRQDAAFFAPAMERTYNSITNRQIIREAVAAKSENESGCSPSEVANWIESVGSKRYPSLIRGDKKRKAKALIIDELTAEDSRNSLAGLGVIRVEPSEFMEGLYTNQVRNVICKQLGKEEMQAYPWLGVEDYALLSVICLESLRERNAILVPEGVDVERQDFQTRKLRARGVSVVQVADKSDSNTIQFIGKTSSTENKRSEFLRKYARKLYGIELSRDDAQIILSSLYKFTTSYLKHLNKRSSGIFDGNQERFRLGMNLWKLYPSKPSDRFFICENCGCGSHLDTHGVCMTYKCQGRMRETTIHQSWGKDRFYKEVYNEEALPIKIEEHTAQLSTSSAREIQSGFIKGEVNVLSCTTTFELGVDVGDLRSIFMRNVPPTTANYTQRAGRVGRRAGMPGYAITFARLRPHDVAFYKNPVSMITGATRVPVCYLENEQIARRHIFAVALSEFFREEGNTNKSKLYNDFLSLDSENPQGLTEVHQYLMSHPEKVEEQLDSLFKDNTVLTQMLGIEDWGWINSLTGQECIGANEGMGRLTRTHLIKHSDYERVMDGIRRADGRGDNKSVKSLYGAKERLEQEKTIAILADGGVLPKYGFPTDLVELHLPSSSGFSGDGYLQLQRGMRQAVREYAPGAEIVAGKKLWKSVGIRRPKGQDLIIRNYGKCPHCEAFAWPIENYSDEYKCQVCDNPVNLKRRMLIPSFGFEGEEQTKGIGLHRPRAKGYTEVHFSQHWPLEAVAKSIEFCGGRIGSRYAGNAELCLVNNASNRGFHVCSYCGAASTDGKNIQHRYFCPQDSSKPWITRYNALGASFTSDVLELSFEMDYPVTKDIEAWESVMWAVFAAASQMLEIPETELGGTMYIDSRGNRSIMIYDNVPGGAGHAKQLFEEVPNLIERAYKIVSECTCGEETCCYGCIANYYNQARQHVLSRGSAVEILKVLLEGI
ncbi:MAG: DEAD/DEAH box helicase [Atopobiaceae bacterium]|nr:DEAD/DEAH box helicase [Atopobiaceae bacterium]